jgi:hypothetical protein
MLPDNWLQHKCNALQNTLAAIASFGARRCSRAGARYKTKTHIRGERRDATGTIYHGVAMLHKKNLQIFAATAASHHEAFLEHTTTSAYSHTAVMHTGTAAE